MTIEPRPDHPLHPSAAEEIGAVLQRLGSRLLWVVAVLGSFTVAANTWRASSHGWSAVYVFDVVAFAGALAALMLRRRLRPQWIFWIITALVFVEGHVRLAGLGLAGAGTMILATSCAFVGVFAGLRPGLYATGVALIGYSVIGLAHTLGWLELPPVVGLAATSPESWLTQGGLFVAFTVTVLMAANSVQQRLLSSLFELTRRGAALSVALEKLGESERKYRLVSENVTDVVFQQDAQLRMLYVSPSVCRVFGYDAEEAIELGMAPLMVPESLQRAHEDYARYFTLAQQGPVDVPLMEYEYIRKDGSTLWGELKVTFLRDEAGQPIGSQGVLRDVTRRKQAELERERLSGELRHSEKMQAVGQLASGVAHDFNNQLAVILGYADLLAGDPATPLVSRAAEQIAAAAQRSADLTGQLLAFGRRGAARSVPVSVHHIIDDVARLLARGVDRRIRIETRLEAEQFVVRADPSQLSTALLNLGLNARDAMPEGGDLVLATTVTAPGDGGTGHDAASAASGWLEIRVTDTGVGMDAELRERVFEPFFTTKPVGRGTGMGLAAVYGTITAHGGTVRLDSTPGVGTTVTIRLPLCADEPEAVSVSLRPHDAVSGEDAQVLLVDDEPRVCEMTRQMLEQAGFRVQAFTDPAEAIAFYEAHPNEVELAIVDLTMPMMTGAQCLEALRRIRAPLPALFVSGDTPSVEAKRFMEAGRCSFLHKPFAVADLITAVQRAAGQVGGPKAHGSVVGPG